MDGACSTYEGEESSIQGFGGDIDWIDLAVGDIDWIDLAHDRVRWQTLVNAVMNLWVQ
jgi:hypothetical protein